VSGPERDEQEARILREAAARLSLLRFEQERAVVYEPALADQFICGYVDGAEGAALERAVAHRGDLLGRDGLTAFAFGWCRGQADLNRRRPVYEHVERWLSRRVPSRV
jgi:hypothetical protein